MLTGDTKATILKHARDLFLEGGLASVQLREVARRTGISATAVYRHFKDKAELIREVVSDGFVRFDQALSRSRTDGTPFERLISLGEAYWKFALEHKQEYRILFSEDDVVDYGKLPREARDAETQSRNRLDSLCREIVSDDEDLARTFAVGVWAVLHGCATLAVFERIPVEEAERAWKLSLSKMV